MQGRNDAGKTILPGDIGRVSLNVVNREKRTHVNL